MDNWISFTDSHPGPNLPVLIRYESGTVKIVNSSEIDSAAVYKHNNRYWKPTGIYKEFCWGNTWEPFYYGNYRTKR